jgi:hypothetical protein
MQILQFMDVGGGGGDTDVDDDDDHVGVVGDDA